MLENSQIRLRKIFPQSISSRESVRLIEKEIAKRDAEKLTLDFDDITFASPSFISELIQSLNERSDKIIGFVNMADSVKVMFKVAKARRRRNSKNVDHEVDSYQVMDIREVCKKSGFKHQ